MGSRSPQIEQPHDPYISSNKYQVKLHDFVLEKWIDSMRSKLCRGKEKIFNFVAFCRQKFEILCIIQSLFNPSNSMTAWSGLI